MMDNERLLCTKFRGWIAQLDGCSGLGEPGVGLPRRDRRLTGLQNMGNKPKCFLLILVNYILMQVELDSYNLRYSKRIIIFSTLQ